MTNFTAFGYKSPWTADSIYAPKVLVLCCFVGVGLLAWGVAVLRGDLAIRVPRRWWLPLCVSVLIVASAGFGIDARMAVVGSNEFLQGSVVQVAALGAYWLSIQMVSDTARLRDMTRVTVAGSAMVALYALAQIAGLDPSVWPSAEYYHFQRGFATLGNPDMLGVFLVVGAVLAPAVALSESRVRNKVVWWVLSAVLGTVTLLTMVRAAWFGFAVGIVVLVLLGHRLRLQTSPIDRQALKAISFGLAATVVLRSLTTSGELVRRLVQVFANPEAASSGRFALWREAIDVIGQRPLFGTGPDSYLLGWYSQQGTETMRTAGMGLIVQDPHNTPLMLAATLGVPAVLMLIAWGVTSLRDAAGVVGSTQGQPQRSMLPYAGWIAAVVAFAAASFFGITTIAPAVLLASGLGVLSAPLAHDVTPSHGARRGVAVATGVLALLLLMFGSSVTMAEYYRMRSIAAPTMDAAVQYADRAVRWMPLHYTHRLHAANARAYRSLQELSATAGVPSTLADTQAYYRTLLTQFPDQYDGYVRYAALLSDVSDRVGPSALTEAAEVASRGFAVRPKGLRARIIAARAFGSLGDHAGAASCLGDWWDLDPREAEPGVLYALALMNQSKEADALQVLRVLEERFPDSRDVRVLLDQLGG
jgi:O-antigen ligase